ncbi:GlxA family transcriptional regulator [Kiloniella sp.]|uniref:GlxA family transcriptional regulator n=1 Tax=Kiloniella sp. TaxID=1938587 RepID=UPI003B026F4F
MQSKVYRSDQSYHCSTLTSKLDQYETTPVHYFRTPKQQREIRRLTLTVLPGASSVDISLIVQALTTVNFLVGYSVFNWQVATIDGEDIQLSDSFILPAHIRVAENDNLDLNLIFGEWHSCEERGNSLSNWLKRLDRKGVYIGSIGGAFCELLNSGLLEGYLSSIPLSYHDSVRELHPGIEISDDLFSWDRRRLTCSGRTACLNMILSVIEHQCGREMTEQVAEAFNYEPTHSYLPQRRRDLALQKYSKKLALAVNLMEGNLEDILTTAEISQEIGCSKRQMERLFCRHLDTSPRRFYKQLRLKKARSLLQQTALPISEIAIACGFVSFSDFSKSYRNCFNVNPREDRMLTKASALG